LITLKEKEFTGVNVEMEYGNNNYIKHEVRALETVQKML
jgi:hypothetical protein